MHKKTSIMYVREITGDTVFTFHFRKKNHRLCMPFGSYCILVYNPETCETEFIDVDGTPRVLIPKNINSARKMYKELVERGFKETT